MLCRVMIKMSDGITDAYRESRFKHKPILSSITQKINIPKCCKNCIFITRNPHDNRWKCTNPLQSEWACHKEGDCIFHLTCDELAIYTKERLKAKLIKEPTMLNKSPRCKHILDNGIILITDPAPMFQTVSIGFWIKTGSIDETEVSNGYAHLLEHMLFKGTTKRIIDKRQI